MMKIKNGTASDDSMRSGRWGGFDERRDMPHSARRMKKVTLVLTAALVAALVPAQGEAARKRSMSLTDCVQEALVRNLDVQIERINPQISREELRGSYAGYDPTFRISGEHRYQLSGGGFDPTIQFNIPPTEGNSDTFSSGISGGLLPWGTTYDIGASLTESVSTFTTNRSDTTRGSAGITLTQPLLKNFLIDGTRLRISVAKNRLNYSEMGLRAKIMDVVTSVEKAYYDLIAAQENVKVQEQALQLAQQLLSENKKRVEVGTMAPLDEKQAESQVAGSRADLLSAQQALSAAENALRSLINDNYRDYRGLLIEPAEQLAAPVQQFNVQQSWSKGLAQRPEFLQAKLNAEQSELNLKYDRNQMLPDLALTGSYGHGAGGVAVQEFGDGLDDLRTGRNPTYSYGARLSIPLGNRAARSTYRTSRLALEQVKLSLKKTEEGILVEIDNNITTARVSLERVTARREARLYSEAALDAERKKLENGKSTSFFVLQLQKDLTGARSAEIGALADYNKALADLARSEGSTLERRAINLQIQ